MNPRLPIFVSYAHKDVFYLENLLNHLTPLKMQNQVCAWSDKDIEPGSNWSNGISTSIVNARVCVLLISKNFLASEFIRNREIPQMLDRKDKNKILPIIVGPCLLDLAEFKYPDPELGPNTFHLSSIQALNDPNKPISSLSESEQDIIYVKAAKTLYQLWKR